MDDLLLVESGLTGAAMDFIESLDLKREISLSDKQSNWLEDLAEKHL